MEQDIHIFKEVFKVAYSYDIISLEFEFFIL